VHAPRSEARSTLADDARAGLAARPRSIPPKHFYDAAGSALFDAICLLPEYYLTRAERALLEKHASAIVQRAGASELVELGSGMARKTEVLLSAMQRAAASPTYVPFDISRDALERAAPLLLARMPGLRVQAVVGDFTQDMGALARRSTRQRGAARRIFALLGSTIGNLDEREAPALLRSVANVMDEGDSFLLGLDLVKDERALHAAYNDAAGVTARFNKNVLSVMNRELGATFALDAWEHDARYDTERARIEMRLVAREAHAVHLAAVGMRVEFDARETILTEISRKFTRSTAETMLREGGMTLDAWLSDGAFALAFAKRYSSAAR
jgi:L-histidine N-alpha-methyltransferase